MALNVINETIQMAQVSRRTLSRGTVRGGGGAAGRARAPSESDAVVQFVETVEETQGIHKATPGRRDC